MSCSLLAAITLAERAHQGQMRDDGSPFIGHPLAVLSLLWGASLELPLAAYITAVLHDVLEDTDVTYEEILLLAGDEVASAVNLLTRPDALPLQNPIEAEHGYLRRLIWDVDRYPYVPLIKIADRIHNVETASASGTLKREEVLEETRNLYIPFFASHAPTGDPYKEAHVYLLGRLKRAVFCTTKCQKRLQIADSVSPVDCAKVPFLVS